MLGLMIADEVGLIQVSSACADCWPPNTKQAPGCPERPLISMPQIAALHELHVLERQAAHRLAGGGEDRVHDRRRDYANGRLADAAPEVVARHQEATRPVAAQHS